MIDSNVLYDSLFILIKWFVVYNCPNYVLGLGC